MVPAPSRAVAGQAADATALNGVYASARSPRDWAALASNNQIESLDHPQSVLRYRVHSVNAKGDRIRDVVECAGGSVSRLLAIDGRPLTAEQESDERARLEALAHDPEEFHHHSAENASSRKLARDLISFMPDAMIYTPVSGGTSGQDAAGASFLVFDFAPNPNWHPPSTTAEALTGLRGRVWINRNSGFVERMQGEVFRPVNFGFGIVARIFPGGHLSFEQIDAGHHDYIYSHYLQRLRARALVFKIVDLNMALDTSDYHTLPAPLTYQEAIRLLLH